MILVIIIASIFYKLADKYNENKWTFAIASIAVYFGSSFLIGIIIGVFCLIMDFDIDQISDSTITIASLIFGITCSYIFYKLLEKKWKKKAIIKIDEIDLIGTNNDIKNKKAD